MSQRVKSQHGFQLYPELKFKHVLHTSSKYTEQCSAIFNAYSDSMEVTPCSLVQLLTLIYSNRYNSSTCGFDISGKCVCREQVPPNLCIDVPDYTASHKTVFSIATSLKA
jgi:hypothetical protein